LERTIYRDIGELMGRGVPVWGEPGVGYALRGSFDLPPLMFDEQELESPMPGAWLLAAWCELRRDSRSFRVGRMSALIVLKDRFQPEHGRTLQDFLRRQTHPEEDPCRKANQ
jgi:predicted DNA-binding transcriptional regulator YafY